MAERNSITQQNRQRIEHICKILNNDVNEWLEACSKFPNPLVVIEEWEQIAEAYGRYRGNRRLSEDEKEEAVAVIQDIRATLKANEMLDDETEEPELDELVESYDLPKDEIRKLIAIVFCRGV